MIVVVVIALVILWAFIQKSLGDAGVRPRSRGSLRYQRRQAQKHGVDPEHFVVRPRGSPPLNEFDKIVRDHQRGKNDPFAKIVRDSKRHPFDKRRR